VNIPPLHGLRSELLSPPGAAISVGRQLSSSTDVTAGEGSPDRYRLQPERLRAGVASPDPASSVRFAGEGTGRGRDVATSTEQQAGHRARRETSGSQTFTGASADSSAGQRSGAPVTGGQQAATGGGGGWPPDHAGGSAADEDGVSEGANSGAVAELLAAGRRMPVVLLIPSRAAAAAAGLHPQATASAFCSVIAKPLRKRPLASGLQRMEHWLRVAEPDSAAASGLPSFPSSTVPAQQPPTSAGGSEPALGPAALHELTVPSTTALLVEDDSRPAAVTLPRPPHLPLQAATTTTASEPPPASTAAGATGAAVVADTAVAAVAGPGAPPSEGGASGPPNAEAALADEKQRVQLLLSSLRVCVAEDNAVNIRLVQRMLSKMGIKPLLVADGIEAVEAAQAQDFDLIFMDVDMPRLSGLGATGRIRASLPEARQPWIVAMTAAAFEEDRQRCADAGMDDFVAKPFTERDLRERLQVYLRRKGRL